MTAPAKPLTAEEERELRERASRNQRDYAVDVCEPEILQLLATLDAERALRAEAEAKADRLAKQQHDDFVRLSKLVWPYNTKHPATDSSAIMTAVEMQFDCGDCDNRCSFRYCEDCAPERDCVEDATAKRIAEWLRTQAAVYISPVLYADCIERGDWRR